MKFIFRWVVKLSGVPSVLLFFLPKIKYENKEKTKGKMSHKEPAVVITNHKNFMDFILFLAVFFKSYLRCVVGKTLYESNKIVSVMLNLLGAIKIDRFSFDMDFFFKSSDALKKGHKVLIFPEGRFSVNDEILEFKSSAALIALQSNVPIIPVYHTTKYGFMKSIKVMIGEPIYLSDYYSGTNPSAEELCELTEILRNKIIELRDKCTNEA